MRLLATALLFGAAVAAPPGPPPSAAGPLASILDESHRLVLAGQWDEAARRLDVEIARAPSEVSTRLALRIEKGRVLADRSFFHRKDAANVRQALEAAHREARASGADALAADATQVLAQLDYSAAFGTGDWDTPRAAFLEAARARETAGDVRGFAQSTFYVGLTYEQAGRPEPAMERYRAALALAEKAGDAVQQSYAHRHIGGLLEEKGDLDAAERHIALSLALRRKAGFRVGVPYALLQMADFVAAHKADAAGAVRLREEAVQEATACRSTGALAAAHRALATAALEAGRKDAARTHAEKARAASEAFGDPVGVKSALAILAKL